MIYKGNHKLGDFFTSRRERGTPGLPMLSVTMNNGVVTRESLGRKMETNLSDEEHLLVRKDDIVYNMMRMWQGASGLADRDGLLSPAYVVLAPKKGIDPLYASYLFKSSRLIYLLWAYSYGLTSDRLRLYFNDFKRIPANIPSLPEQRKIGKILLSWDKAIELIEKLLENSKRQKKALMQKLLSGCSHRWRRTSIGQIAKIDTAPSKVDYIDDGGDSYIVDMGSISKDGQFIPSKRTSLKFGYLEVGSLVMPKDDIGGGQIIGRTAYIDQEKKYILGDHVFKLTVNNGCSLFIHYLINHDPINKNLRRKANGTAQLGLNRKDVLKQIISVPVEISEQERIAKILFSADRDIEVLQQKLACLKQEKKALMQQLLTGKRRVKVDES